MASETNLLHYNDIRKKLNELKQTETRWWLRLYQLLCLYQHVTTTLVRWWRGVVATRLIRSTKLLYAGPGYYCEG